MSDDDIRRIADAIENMVKINETPPADEIIAAIHEAYADNIKAIFDNSGDTFQTMKSFRSLELLARQTAIQIRNK